MVHNPWVFLAQRIVYHFFGGEAWYSWVWFILFCLCVPFALYTCCRHCQAAHRARQRGEENWWHHLIPRFGGGGGLLLGGEGIAARNRRQYQHQQDQQQA